MGWNETVPGQRISQSSQPTSSERFSPIQNFFSDLEILDSENKLQYLCHVFYIIKKSESEKKNSTSKKASEEAAAAAFRIDVERDEESVAHVLSPPPYCYQFSANPIFALIGIQLGGGRGQYKLVYDILY